MPWFSITKQTQTSSSSVPTFSKKPWAPLSSKSNTNWCARIFCAVQAKLAVEQWEMHHWQSQAIVRACNFEVLYHFDCGFSHASQPTLTSLDEHPSKPKKFGRNPSIDRPPLRLNFVGPCHTLYPTLNLGKSNSSVSCITPSEPTVKMLQYPKIWQLLPTNYSHCS
jgi:hypothetical protein